MSKEHIVLESFEGKVVRAISEVRTPEGTVVGMMVYFEDSSSIRIDTLSSGGTSALNIDADDAMEDC